MKQLITIFKNLGTIVILLFQIAYEATIDYLSTPDNTVQAVQSHKDKEIKNKTFTERDNKPLYKRTRRNNENI